MDSILPPERRSEIMLQNIDLSDCGVIALQAITGMERAEAEEKARKLAGYTPGVGITRGMLNRALARLGWKLEMAARITDRYTVATFASFHEYGRFIIYTSGHVSALVEGDLFNADGNWHTPVEEAYRVYKL